MRLDWIWSSDTCGDGRGGGAEAGGVAAVLPEVAVEEQVQLRAPRLARPEAGQRETVRLWAAVVTRPQPAEPREGGAGGGAGESRHHHAAPLHGVPRGRQWGGGPPQGWGGREQHRPRWPDSLAHRRLRRARGCGQVVAQLQGQHRR